MPPCTGGSSKLASALQDRRAQRYCPCFAGKYLEIFGRKNNLRNYWVTIGNEVTGTGLPNEDQKALHALQPIPGAVYGARNRTN